MGIGLDLGDFGYDIILEARNGLLSCLERQVFCG